MLEDTWILYKNIFSVLQGQALGDEYISYRNAIRILDLDDLETRRNQLCLKFGKKCEKSDEFNNWFRLNTQSVNTIKKRPSMLRWGLDYPDLRKARLVSWLTC